MAAAKKTLPEELFGRAWARRLRIGIPLTALGLFLAGCVVFAAWSQFIGKLVLAASFGLGYLWFVFRRGDPHGATDSLRRRRPHLFVLAGVLVAGGIAVFAAVDQDVGLLLVFLGAVILIFHLAGVRRESIASPTDGPYFGDTPPYGQ